VKKAILAASLATVALTGCALVPYGPAPVVEVGVYAAPPPVVYVQPHAYGYARYGPRGWYGPYRW